jgi:hypothetical protein
MFYFRQRIKEIFKDGDVVTVTLKNRGDKQTDDEIDWYSKAFGPR